MASRVLTAVENLIGAITTASRQSQVTFGGTKTNSWMVNFLGLLASTVAGRGASLIGVAAEDAGLPANAQAALEQLATSNYEHRARFDLTGAAGGEGYEGGKRFRVPLAFTARERAADGCVLLIEHVNAALDLTGTAWVRFGWTDDGYSSVTFLTAIASVTAAATEFDILEGAETVPDGAIVFVEIDVGNAERIAGTAIVNMV